jgi:HAD superfamily hydrolase (TIGR01509 family)
LSNASDNARQIFGDRYGMLDHFDSVTVSAEERVMKPNPRIYHTALSRAGAEPGEAVFVDDFIENVEAARVLGIHGVHFQQPGATLALLAELTGVPRRA